MGSDDSHPTSAEMPLMTAEDFYQRFAGRDFELVCGRVVARAPTSALHGSTDSILAHRVGSYIRERGLGGHYLNTGFILFRNPDVIRSPDQAYVSAARIQACPPPEAGFWALAPDLAIEIVSPSDSAETIAEKVSEYLAAGVRLVWILYPRQKQAHVYRPGSDPRILVSTDTLEGEDVLPAFSLPLADLWPA
jgi:Uma2 family endonuclease